MKTMKNLIFISTLLFVSGEAMACNKNEMLKVLFFFFGDETYLPIKIKDIKNKPDGFMIREEDFSQLLLLAKPAKGDWFENVRIRVKAKNGVYFINKNGVIYFNKSIIGQLDKDVLNSIDFGFGLYDAKTCAPLNVQMITILEKSNNLQLKEYFDNVGELADWRTTGFIGYKKN